MAPEIQKLSDQRNVSTIRRNDLITGGPFREEDLVVDLGVLPVPGLFFESPVDEGTLDSPIKLFQSSESGLFQLDHDLNPDLYSHYYPGPPNQSQRDYLEKTAEEIESRFSKEDVIVDVGGGQGHLLKILAERGFQNLWLLDPTATSDEDSPIHALRISLPGNVPELEGEADLIISQHFLEHCSDPRGFLNQARSLLSDSGEVWIEVPDLEASALSESGVHLSMIYALHSNYFDTRSLQALAAHTCFDWLEGRLVDHYGKSVVARLAPSASETPPANLIQDWSSEKDEAIRSRVRQFFRELSGFADSLPSPLPCWGVAERCLAMLGVIMQSGFQPSLLIDSNPQIQGQFTPFSNLPVCSPTDLKEPLKEVVVLAGSYASEILSANRERFSSNAIVHIPLRGQVPVSDLLEG